jgi:hypothetical protein
MELIYRDSGLPGDSFSELVVRDLPAALTDGGLAHALVTWTHGADEDWTRPVRDWLRGSSCDALVFREATHEPLSYAASWNEGLPAAALAETLDRWTGYYRRLGIERISWGTVVLRRRPGTNWAFFASPEGEVTGPAGEHLLRLFAARDYLAGLPADDALLDASLALAPEHRLDQEIRVAGGEATIERSLLRLEPGIGFRVPVDGATALVLAHLDGRRSVRAAVGEAARSAGPDTDPRGLEPALLPPLRRLLELGFLVPGAS